MLYYFLTYLDRLYDIPGFGVFRFITFRAGAAAVTALPIAFWVGPKIIRRLRERQTGEAAKVEAPKTHLTKAGTPTMGGLIVLSSTVIPALLWADVKNGYVILILFVTIALGAVGFLDDYLKVVRKKPKGLIGRYKIVGQVIVGLVVGGVIFFYPEWIDPNLVALKSKTTVPFFKNLELDLGWLYIPLVIFIITATSNAVNLTDGLDGLAIGTVGIVALTLAIIAYASGHAELSQYLTIPFLRGNGELAIYCAALVGAALGFLWLLIPCPGFHGRHRLSRPRGRSRRHVRTHEEGTSAADTRRCIPYGNRVGHYSTNVFQIHEEEIRRRPEGFQNGPLASSF